MDVEFEIVVEILYKDTVYNMTVAMKYGEYCVELTDFEIMQQKE